jgi:hypothetical protein
LEAFALISHLARRGTLTEDLRPWLRGWPDGVFTRGGQGDDGTEASVRFVWGRSNYSLILKKPERPEIASEELVVGTRRYV